MRWKKVELVLLDFKVELDNDKPALAGYTIEQQITTGR